jgi:Coenzyme PQQ synthesis protein D (PqqD)
MPFRRTPGVTYEMSGDRAVILDAAGSVMTTLNEVGTVIWCELDGERDADELAADLAPRFDGIETAALRADIDEFAASLLEAGLISEV